MPTYKEEKDFIEEVIPRGLLEDAINWIRNKMTPEDVFSTADLEKWAESEGYVKGGNNE